MKLFTCIVLSAFLLSLSKISANTFNMNVLNLDSTEIKENDIPLNNPIFFDAKLLYKSTNDKEYIYNYFFEKGILFKIQESNLNDESKKSLNKLIDFLSKNPTVSVKLVGHTDIKGSLEINQYLSIERARVVAIYLISNKVPENQISEIIGKNFSDPVADNLTESGRAANRCVEVFVKLPKTILNSVKTKHNTKTIKSATPELQKTVDQVINIKKQTNETDLEIDGLIVDDTKTKSGKDFYDVFYSNWEPPANAKNYTITISEKPYRLNYTLVVVSINDYIVYQTVLQPRQDIVESQSYEAVSDSQDYLLNYEEITNMMNGEDLKGTGIY